MTEKKISTQGIETNYKITGEGKPLLILHGWGSSSEKWQRVGELLAEKGFKVIVPDLPGFGMSAVPPKPWSLDNYCSFVADFAEALKLEKFHLLGHSFGGALAMKYALKFPEKIDRLFLAGAALIRKQTPKKKILASLSKVFKVFSFLPFYKFFRKAFYKFIVRKSDYLCFEGVMKESYLKIIKEDLSNDLSEVKVPTVIIWGGKDNITPLKDAYLIHKKIQNSKLFIIPDVGHDLEQKLPDLLTRF